jgi:hypothetical protein
MFQRPASSIADAWWEVFKNRRLNVSQVIMIVTERQDPEAKFLESLFLEAAPSPYPGVISHHKLGRFLARGDGGPRFALCGTEYGRKVWQLAPPTPVEEDDDGLPPLPSNLEVLAIS